jgi:hypothetical protein
MIMFSIQKQPGEWMENKNTDVAPVTDVATPWPKSPPSGPSTLTHATRDKVNSFLSILDLVNTLDGMLPHVGMLYVIRYESHRGPERRNTHGARKQGKGRGAIHHGARKKEEEEEEEEEEEGKRRRRLAGPEPGWTGPTTGLSGCRPVDRPQDRTTRSQARSDRPQTGSDGNDSPSCLSYPLAYLFGPSWLVPLYKHLGPLLYPLDKI